MDCDDGEVIKTASRASKRGTQTIVVFFAASARTGLEVGKQFTYDVTVMVGAGTMDFAPHASGFANRYTLKLQTKSEDVLMGQVSSIQGP